MTKGLTTSFLCLFFGGCLSGQSAEESAQAISMSINELMVTEMTPATDTLWGIEDPQTAEEWQVFVDAAEVVIDAGKTVKLGGTGPNDDEWASGPDWQVFADRLIGAGEDALVAAQNKDLEAMYAAGELLYPPCEECHIQFHPGVQGYE